MRRALLLRVSEALGLAELQTLALDDAAELEDFSRESRRRDRRLLAQLQASMPLPLAPQPTAAPATPQKEERARLKEAQQVSIDERELAKLRIVLRAILDDFSKDPRLRPFARPVDPEEVPDYYEVVAQPMDLSTMAEKVDAKQYLSYESFAADLDLITANAVEYNPDDARGMQIKRSARRLRDAADTVAHDCDRRMGGKVLRRCREIEQRRLGPRASRAADTAFLDAGAAASLAKRVHTFGLVGDIEPDNKDDRDDANSAPDTPPSRTVTRRLRSDSLVKELDFQGLIVDDPDALARSMRRPRATKLSGKKRARQDNDDDDGGGLRGRDGGESGAETKDADKREEGEMVEEEEEEEEEEDSGAMSASASASVVVELPPEEPRSVTVEDVSRFMRVCAAVGDNVSCAREEALERAERMEAGELDAWTARAELAGRRDLSSEVESSLMRDGLTSLTRSSPPSLRTAYLALDGYLRIAQALSRP